MNINFPTNDAFLWGMALTAALSLVFRETSKSCFVLLVQSVLMYGYFSSTSPPNNAVNFLLLLSILFSTICLSANVYFKRTAPQTSFRSSKIAVAISGIFFAGFYVNRQEIVDFFLAQHQFISTNLLDNNLALAQIAFAFIAIMISASFLAKLDCHDSAHSRDQHD